MKADRPSATAALIAAATLLLAADKRQEDLVAPGAVRLCQEFLSGSLAGKLLAGSAQCVATRWFWRMLERVTLPGIVTHYWLRKRWIEACCREHIAAGGRRIIVLGAGFDTLACRLITEFPALTMIEIDHPATQAAKRKALRDDLRYARLQFLACDLGHQDLPLALRPDEHDTLIIAEGLLMYLLPEAIDRLFKGLHTLCARRLHFLFTTMTRWPDGSTGFRPRSYAIERWLAGRSEAFHWALADDALTEFLNAQHFNLLQRITGPELRSTSSLPDCPLEGENLVLCERQD